MTASQRFVNTAPVPLQNLQCLLRSILIIRRPICANNPRLSTASKPMSMDLQDLPEFVLQFVLFETSG
jgi:hypothetical protein